MAKPTLAERALRIRKAAGYGEPRRQAEFARLLGIKPPSLHSIENGETLNLQQATIEGYLRIGASPDYLFNGRGEPMLGNIERRLRNQTTLSMMDELDDDEHAVIDNMIKVMIRKKGKPSPNDPYLEDPPKDPPRLKR
jgi:transcriptional regulator with XRE-family HTH domain